MRPAPARPISPRSAGIWQGTSCKVLMADISALGQPELDEHFLRQSFDVARRAITHGNHPFGALLVDANRHVLLEAENGYMPSRDDTAHAERLLATQACTTIDANILRGATLYSSA